MNSLNELRSLLNRSTSTVDSGVVVSTKEGALMVRTRTGTREVQYAGSQFRVGDTVRLQGSVLLGRAASADSLPVFRV